MEFDGQKDQLNLFLSEADEALDIVAELIGQMGHTGAIDKVRYSEQTNRWLTKLEQHPSFRAAKARKSQRFWGIIGHAAKEVESWPDWMKGK